MWMVPLLFLFSILPTEVLAQEQHPLINEHEWISKKKNPTTGGGCCGKNDVYSIPTNYALGLKVGDIAELKTEYGPYKIIVDVIYPSQDSEGRSYITTYGCLFVIPGI